MDVRIDGAYGWTIRRDADWPLAAAARSESSSDPAGSVPTVTAAAVAPAASAASVHTKPARKDPLDSDGGPSSQTAPLNGDRYEQRLVYDTKIKRLFVDIIDKESRELLVRMPPERLARYLEEAKALTATKPTDTARERLDTSA